jgi:predicted dehydrogenase
MYPFNEDTGMYRVGILGLGRIAAGYSGPEDIESYTHAGGIHHSDQVTLGAVADFSEAALGEFADKWGQCFPGVQYHSSLNEMMRDGEIDILSICIRGPHHYSALLEGIQAGPGAIFLEKPPTCSLKEMDAVLKAAGAARIPITVSYSRHWGAHVLWMAKLIDEGLIGQITGVVGYCGGPFLSFAAHTTDMICQFAGYEPVAVYARGMADDEAVPEGFEPEPRLHAMLIEFKSGIVGTQIGQPGEHGSFYCEVNGENGRAYIPFYGTPRAWDNEGQVIDLEALGMPAAASPFTLAYDQIANHLDGGPLPDCTNNEFVAVHDISFAGIESVLTDQRVTLPNRNRDRRIFANG